MENITVVGLKEMNYKLGHIERGLDEIAKSLSTLTKIMNRRFPDVRVDIPSLNPNKEDDDEM